MPDAAPDRDCPRFATVGTAGICLAVTLWAASSSQQARAEFVTPGVGAWGGSPTIVRLPLKERENSWRRQAAVRSGPISVRAIEETYRSHGVDLGEVLAAERLEIPRLAFSMVPGDLGEAMTATRRKQVFVGLLLPAVLAVNEALWADRTQLEIMAWQPEITEEEARWLQELGDRYGCRADPVALLDRVDIIPTPIALAQAALESGWGRSRFARHGNALFGKRTSAADLGMKPLAKSSKFFIERFDHVLDSVASYAFILNSGGKFREFRARRAAMREARAALDSLELVATLAGYSERGAAYVKALETMIAVNGFSALADAHFAERPATGGSPRRLGPDLEGALVGPLMANMLFPISFGGNPARPGPFPQPPAHLAPTHDVPLALLETAQEYLP